MHEKGALSMRKGGDIPHEKIADAQEILSKLTFQYWLEYNFLTQWWILGITCQTHSGSPTLLPCRLFVFTGQVYADLPTFPIQGMLYHVKKEIRKKEEVILHPTLVKEGLK